MGWIWFSVNRPLKITLLPAVDDPAIRHVDETMVPLLGDEIVAGHGDGGELRIQRGIAQQRQEREPGSL